MSNTNEIFQPSRQTLLIHGIAFRDQTMLSYDKIVYIDYRSPFEDKQGTNIVVMAVDVSEELEGWAGSFDSKDWSVYLKLLKGDWGPSKSSNGIASVVTYSERTDGRKAPLGIFTLMQELVSRVTDIDFLEEEPEFLKGKDDDGEFLYVVHKGKNYLIEQQDRL